MTIRQRFEHFTKNIRPTDEHIEEANRQTDYMVKNLKNKVSADGTFTLEKTLKAGSNAKFTSLLETEENLFDVDVGAYYSGDGASKDKLDTLLDFTRDRLREIYPTKADADFVTMKSAVRVKFRSGIKLNVDVAPIIRDDALGFDNGGWIPRADGWRLTSVTCHNKFVSSRSSQSANIAGPVKFNRLIRLIKWWNNRLGDLTQPSIFCELVAAAAVEGRGATGEWQTSLRQVFDFLRKHQLGEAIIFADYYDPKAVVVPADPVVVLDSVNRDNNVASAWTEETRRAFIEQVEEAYDAMAYARSCELDGDEDGAVDEWCRVFGERFRRLSEPDEEEE